MHTAIGRGTWEVTHLGPLLEMKKAFSSNLQDQHRAAEQEEAKDLQFLEPDVY